MKLYKGDCLQEMNEEYFKIAEQRINDIKYELF